MLKDSDSDVKIGSGNIADLVWFGFETSALFFIINVATNDRDE